jgi:hypothetical protein
LPVIFRERLASFVPASAGFPGGHFSPDQALTERPPAAERLPAVTSFSK